MGLNPYVFDATAANFQTLVLENSRRGLVLVHFWSPRAGPCMVLMPRLVKLAAEYGGKFLLVMLNTDEIGTLARRLGVTSVPTVKFFRNGEVVHTIHGAESDNTFREAVGRFTSINLPAQYLQGLTAWREGDINRAQHQLAQAAMDDPDNPAIPADLAKLLWSSGMREEALNLLRALPDNIRTNPDIARLHSHFLLAHTAVTAPDKSALLKSLEQNPEDHASRFQLAARQVAEDQTEAALASLVEIIKRDANWQSGQARNVMRHLVEWLGPGSPLAEKYGHALDSGQLH